MSISKFVYDLSGLIKYADRAPWDEALNDILTAHLGLACETTGLDPDAIFEMIGDHWQGPLWGCAFEDLLAQELAPDGRNLVDEYLRLRSWHEKAPNKAYMRSLRNTVMSLYEVSEVVAGQSMTLRDLLRDVEPVTVYEQSATRSLFDWDKIAARIVKVDGKYGISGALLPFSVDGAQQLIDTFSGLVNEAPNITAINGSDRDTFLRASGPIFTNLWLIDCLDKIMSESMPDMVNADGDDLVFHRIVFPLAKGVASKDVARRLNAVQSLEPASDTFWNWLTTKKKTSKSNKGKQSLVTTMDDGRSVFANIKLARRKLVVEVNSAIRAE